MAQANDLDDAAVLRARVKALESELATLQRRQPRVTDTDAPPRPLRAKKNAGASGRTAEQHGLWLQWMAAQLVSVEQRERRRLAKTLHEGLQQLLVVARMTIERGQRYIEQGATDTTASVLAQAIALIDESFEASRNLSQELCPPVLYDRGLGAALVWLADDFSRRHPVHVTAHVSAAVATVNADVEAFLFQAVRDLLRRAEHYASSRAKVTMYVDEDGVATIAVEDDGTNAHQPLELPDTSAGAGIGAAAIGDRLSLLGGSMVVDMEGRVGRRVQIRCPLDLGAAPPGAAKE